MSVNEATVKVLREAAPYIQSHRDKLFVIYLDSWVLDRLGEASTDHLIMDIALLHCFGVRLVVIFGIRHQLDRVLQGENMPSTFDEHDDWRATSAEQLAHMQQVTNEYQTRLANLLRRSLIYHGGDDSHFDVLTDQRLVLARPFGIKAGVDYKFTGQVNKILTEKIHAQTRLGNLILISPLASSSQGQLYNLRAIEVALAAASSLAAHKLIVIGADIPAGASRSFYHAEEFYREMDDIARDIAAKPGSDLLQRIVRESIDRNIGRIHFIDHGESDGLLKELFTHEGCGMLISCDPYEQFRPAQDDDVQRIIELYRPAQDKGEVVARDRQQLLNDIDSYYLLLCDQVVIGVVALSPLDEEDSAEIHGLAVDPQYRHQGRGRRLVLSLIEKARRQGYKQLFALTTQAQAFFSELGMERVELADLPANRTRKIPPGRGSRVFRLDLKAKAAKQTA